MAPHTLIDHPAAHASIKKIEDAREARIASWNQVRSDFEQLQAAQAMTGPASVACQLSVQRVDEGIVHNYRREVMLIDEINGAMADDIRTEEDSSTLFHQAAGGH